MINEKAVKKLILETVEKTITGLGTPSQCFPSSLTITHDNGRLFCANVLSKSKESNIVNVIGHLLIRGPKPLWGMNYDGWYKKDQKAIYLQEEGLKKTFLEMGQQQKQIILLEKDGLKYENKINGQFSLFDFEETITNYFNCLSYYRYRGRALVNLNS